MKNRLYAGYFVGEFGWLLMRWQAKIRAMSKNYYHTVVGCEKSMRFLFADFADMFVDFENQNIPIENRNMWMANQQTYPIDTIDEAEYIVPSRQICLSGDNQKFIRYGKKKRKHKTDVLIHARATNNLNTGYRNWPVEKWDGLVWELKKHDVSVGCVGSHEGARYINGTVDYIGVPLSDLADIMASSKVLLSPSSGPAHFASLCGLKHVVWSDNKDKGLYGNFDRYKKDWNPLKTQCEFIPKWQPGIKEVLECIL